MTRFKDVFISYGRADSKDFAIKLEQRLVAAGFSVWLDLNDIPLGIDFQKHIDTSLPKAHNFLYVVSPYAIDSEYCTLELERALLFNKRILPLIHVEEIPRETWQQRYPQGTDADWAQYQAQGRHSIYPNMHPTIRKLNWALFQEDQVDFEQAFQGLVTLLTTETDYVHRHTKLLDQALTWTDHQYQLRYLLTGKARQAAMDWLLQNNELVSCQPSELHCEFICQSIKNAQNLMCHVFLASATEDEEIVQKIRRTLSQQAITVWTSRTDILTGEEFTAAIYRGIEQADSLIYLISPDAVESSFCQDELNYALSLNKRIIPILIRPTETEKIPQEIRGIQYIQPTDLTNDTKVSTKTEDYFIDEDQLLQILKKDAPYHREHKDLLVKALKWQRQEHNPSILLKRHSLTHYSTWLDIAQQRELYGPVQLQIEFINASLQQSPDMTLDAFIVSTSTDLDFARKLNETLQVQGKSTWFEQEHLRSDTDSDTDYEAEINAGITASENIIFILSPQAKDSKKCTRIIEHALAFNKRILIVLYAETLGTEIPESLQGDPIVDFRQQDGDFLSNFGHLYRALESNPQYVHEHTRLLIKAEEWQQGNQDDSFLLRGRTLASAEAWLSTAQKPQPTASQRQYIRASRELPLRRVRLWSVILFGAATTLVVEVARIVGLFQSAELAAYGHLLRQRPHESPDQRFLIVKVDQSSGQDLRDKTIAGVYKPGIGSIPDEALLEGLTALAAHNPRLIGLDFYRDFPVDPDVPELADRLATMDNLLGICKAQTISREPQLATAGPAADPSDLRGFPPIDEVLPDDYPRRIGFNDLLDDGNITVRRHYLVKPSDSDYCDVSSAFSLLLVKRYLETEGGSYTSPLYERDGIIEIQPNGMQVNQVTVPQLRAGGRAGGLYFDPAELAGYQTLLNFRLVEGDPQAFAPTVLFKEVLAGTITPEQIRDRIVLIGYTDLSDNNTDSWNTPFEDMPGVMLHGQMASQLISAALDDRPLIWWLPLGGEFLWIFGWSVVGGLTAWGFYRSLSIVLATSGGLLLIYVVSWGTMIGYAGLLPMVPAIATLLITGGAVTFCNHRLRKV